MTKAEALEQNKRLRQQVEDWRTRCEHLQEEVVYLRTLIKALNEKAATVDGHNSAIIPPQ